MKDPIDRNMAAWEDVVLNLYYSILGEEDDRVDIITDWIDRIRKSPAHQNTRFMIRTVLRDQSK